jgi:3-oxoacyl-[acyl-carrier-protein] synthase-3
MALDAANKALAEAGLKPTDIDLILLATASGDVPFPATASLVQGAGGFVNAAATDVNNACAGWLYTMDIARHMMQNPRNKHVLIIGVERLSTLMNYKDRGSCILFGDGAGAAVLGPNNGKRQIIWSNIGADGTQWEAIHIPGGGSTTQMTPEKLENNEDKIVVHGRQVYKFAVGRMVALIKEAMDEMKWSAGDVDLVVPHQVNLRILDAARERLELSEDKLMVNIEKYGNTSAASVPIALHEAMTTGRLKDGMNMILCAFGAGLSWSSAVLKW